MMGVGAKRALGLYRSCAPRQLICGLFQEGRVLAQVGVADGAGWSHPVSAKGIWAVLTARLALRRRLAPLSLGRRSRSA